MAVRQARQAMLAFLLIVCIINGVFGCVKHKYCVSCTADKACGWCPSSKRCYSLNSATKPCGNETIKDLGLCFNRKLAAYSHDNGYINMLLSAASYSVKPQRCIDKMFPKNTFTVVKQLQVKCDFEGLVYDKCLAFVAVSRVHKIITVAYRGTDTFIQLMDIFWSLVKDKDTPFKIGGRVLYYVERLFKTFYPYIKGHLKRLLTKYVGFKIIATGHSLGGALASLTTVSLIHDKIVDSKSIAMYSYGMPRVGNTKYALKFDNLVRYSWQVVNHRDLIVHTPFCNLFWGCSRRFNGPYHSKTEVFYNTPRMSMDSSFKVCSRNEDPSCSNGLVSRRPCLFDLASCVRDHHYYFNIRIGLYCSEELDVK